jgi:hypothetical protein
MGILAQSLSVFSAPARSLYFQLYGTYALKSISDLGVLIWNNKYSKLAKGDSLSVGLWIQTHLLKGY